MGKYIALIYDEPYTSEHVGENIYRMVNSTKTFTATELATLFTPYTEPDLEQIRKEAYEQGYADGRKKHEVEIHAIAYTNGKQDGYQKGLNDAWDAARKVTQVRKYGGYGDCLEEVFGRHRVPWDVFDYSASEAIEKIRQYEQEKEEQIIKGDIVLIKSTPEVEILATYADEEYVSGIALTEVDGNCEIGDQYTNIRISNVEKTGKHYDIVSVLQKMKES